MAEFPSIARIQESINFVQLVLYQQEKNCNHIIKNCVVAFLSKPTLDSNNQSEVQWYSFLIL